MFRRLLIANRGEVAARIARTAHRLGIEVVAVASAADLGSQWLNEVDQVVPIGPARSALSYLDGPSIVAAARATGCSAVHPGWGFLAENDRFATQCADAGLTFVGPQPHHMRLYGDKSQARRAMQALGMPVIPGTEEPLVDVAEARRAVAVPILPIPTIPNTRPRCR